MAILQRNVVLYSKDNNGNTCIDLPVTDVELVEGLDEKMAFRKANTAYTVGDKVNVPYHAGLVLECITAGTTGSNELDYTGITMDLQIPDGTVLWKVGETGGGTKLPSGVAAGTYGEKDDKLFEHGEAIPIPYFTVDETGVLTEAGTREAQLPLFPEIINISGNAETATRLQKSVSFTIPSNVLTGKGAATLTFNGASDVIFGCSGCSGCTGTCTGTCTSCSGDCSSSCSSSCVGMGCSGR